MTTYLVGESPRRTNFRKLPLHKKIILQHIGGTLYFTADPLHFQLEPVGAGVRRLALIEEVSVLKEGQMPVTNRYKENANCEGLL